MQKLLLHEWPGNVRELEHVMERAVALSERTEIQRAEINLPGSGQTANPENFQRSKAKAVAEFEKRFIQAALVRNRGNKTRAAETLGLHRNTLSRTVDELDIDVREFREGGRRPPRSARPGIYDKKLAR